MNNLFSPQKNFQAQLASTCSLASCVFFLGGPSCVYPAVLGWIYASGGVTMRVFTQWEDMGGGDG